MFPKGEKEVTTWANGVTVHPHLLYVNKEVNVVHVYLVCKLEIRVRVGNWHILQDTIVLY